MSAHGTDDGAHISGGTQLVFGLASGGTVFAGAQVVGSSGTAAATVVSGGNEIVSARGIASGASLFGGTELVASGGTDIGATVHGGGELDVLKGGRASGTLFTSGGLEIVSAGGLVVSAQLQNTGQGGAGQGLGVFGTASGIGRQQRSGGRLLRRHRHRRHGVERRLPHHSLRRYRRFGDAFRQHGRRPRR